MTPTEHSRARRRFQTAGVLAVTLVWALSACGPPREPPPPPESSPAEARVVTVEPFAGLAARYAPRPGSRVYRIRPDLSLVEIQVFREGSLARLGHNHLIAVRELHGWWRQWADGGGNADLWFAVDRLTVDDPVLRQAAGPGFDRQPDAAAIAGTRANLLGEQVLAAAQHPWVRVAAIYHPGQSLAELEIEVRGTRGEYRVPVEVTETGTMQTVKGALSLRQSDFGLRPFSALGGALRVADELRIRFRAVAERVGSQ